MVTDARPGQPTKLTPLVEGKIVGALEGGVSREGAAAIGGISRRTLYNWLEWGENGQEPYVGFLHSVKSAEAEIERKCIDKIASDDSWQSRAWICERKWPDRYALRKPKDEHKQAAEPLVIHINTGDEKDAEIARLKAQLASRTAALEEGK